MRNKCLFALGLVFAMSLTSIVAFAFEQALKYARHKQEYIYQREQREVVLQHWYLVKLTEEYVRSLAFSKFTMDLCSALRDMEKECSDKVRNTLVSNHIVSQPSA